MKQKPHPRGYWKQARASRKRFLLSINYKLSPKTFVYSIPGIMAYSCRPKFKFARRCQLYLVDERNVSNFLLTEKEIMSVWEKCWDFQSRNNEPCASIFNRTINIFARLQRDVGKHFRQYIGQKPTEYTIDAEETKLFRDV